MNGPIMRLFGVALLMFLALVGATSWWTIVKADELNNDHPRENTRALVRSLKIQRGTIRADDGSIIARSVKDEHGLYRRLYPQGARFGHPVGYSFVGRGQTEFEAARNDALMGKEDAIRTTFDELLGRRPRGHEVRTALDPQAQQVALDGIARAGDSGAAVALDPRTGAVKVMASWPGYDPDDIRDEAKLKAFNRDETHKPLVNRAVQFGYAPGSTFKVVTAAAALDSGRFTPQSTVDGDSGQKFSGVPLANDFNQDFGQVDLTTALVKSVNTAWANVGVALGKPTMKRYMERFGFDRKPQITDYPRDAMSVSAVVPTPPGHPVPPTSRYVDLGRLSIGQGGLDATPLQMAQVAAAVANGGRLMKPHITSKILDHDGRTIESVDPEEQATVMRSSTATALKDMMVGVVQRGTGTQAQIPGVQVAGKTGTAETEFGDKINNVWFIGFAPADHPRVAVAVTVKGVQGFGGDFAAPIARDIMQELLKR